MFNLHCLFHTCTTLNHIMLTSSSMIYKDTMQTSVSMIITDTMQTSLSMIIKDTIQTSLSLIIKDTMQTSLPMIIKDTMQTNLSMVKKRSIFHVYSFNPPGLWGIDPPRPGGVNPSALGGQVVWEWLIFSFFLINLTLSYIFKTIPQTPHTSPWGINPWPTWV